LHVEKFGEVCPGSWEEGKVMTQHKGVAEYFSTNQNIDMLIEMAEDGGCCWMK
jgi:hypothetical protein